MLLYLILILDSLLLQPIRCVLGFGMRFLWRPAKVVNGGWPRPLDEVLAIADERLQTLDRSVYGRGNDSAKFLGMLSFATDSDEEWANVMALVNYDGTIMRSNAPIISPVPFSGDMLSGVLLAIVRRIRTRVLSLEDKAKLIALWDKTTWQGFPLLFANAATGKKEVFARGHIWRPWWVFGSEDVLTALAWLYTGWVVTGERRYRIAYYAFLILQAPGLLLGCPDAQIWLGRVYGIATYNTHSKVLGFFAGWKLTGNVFFKMALAQSYKRHGEYNADICILAGCAIKAPGWFATALSLTAQAVKKGCCPCPKDTRYISLFWPPALVQRSGYILAPWFRGGDYIWERNPIKGDHLDDDYRARKGLDLIFPAKLLARYADAV